MKKKLLSVLLCMAMVFTMVPYLGGVIYAADAPTASISDNGILTWTPVEGATRYDAQVTYSISGSSGSFSKSNIGKDGNSFDFKDYLETNLTNSNVAYKNGTYKIKVQALVDGSRLTSNEVQYEFVSTYVPLATPTNIRWDGDTVKWDPVDGATSYDIKMYSGSGNRTGSVTEPQYKVEGFAALSGGINIYLEIVAKGPGYKASAKGTSPTYTVPNKFKTQIANGVVKNGNSYAASYSTNFTASTLGVQAFDSATNDFVDYTYGSTAVASGLVSIYQADNTINRYRLKATRGEEAVYSNEFTVQTTSQTIYTITTQGNGATITGGGKYVTGSAFEIKATLLDGMHFMYWEVDGVKDESLGLEFTATANKNVTYNLVWRWIRTITTETDGCGSVTGGGEYFDGADVTLTATPNEGYAFDYWTKDGVKLDSSYGQEITIDANANMTYKAHFKNVIDCPKGLEIFIKNQGGNCSLNGNTVALTSDVVLGSMMEVLNQAEKPIILDLNGHQISHEASFADTALISKVNDGSLTITDTEQRLDEEGCPFAALVVNGPMTIVANEGTVNLLGISVKDGYQTFAYYRYAIEYAGSAGGRIENCNITVEKDGAIGVTSSGNIDVVSSDIIGRGGTYAEAHYLVDNSGDGSTLTIDNCYVVGETTGAYGITNKTDNGVTKLSSTTVSTAVPSVNCNNGQLQIIGGEICGDVYGLAGMVTIDGNTLIAEKIYMRYTCQAVLKSCTINANNERPSIRCDDPSQITLGPCSSGLPTLQYDEYYEEYCVYDSHVEIVREHTYGEWIVDKKETCIQEGEKHRVCTICEETEVVPIPMEPELGHVAGEWVVDLKATTAPGSKYLECALCGATIDTQAIPAIVLKAPVKVTAVLTTKYSKTGGYNDIKVTWSKVENATGYTVYYKKGTGSYVKMVDTKETTVYKKDLAAGAKYTIKVVPYVTVDGVKYNGSAVKTTTVYTLKKLNAPVVTKSGTKVKVKWNNVEGETGYQISQSTTKKGTKIVTTYATTKGTYKLLKATKGKTYYYKVRAYKTVGGVKIYGPWSVVKAFKR